MTPGLKGDSENSQVEEKAENVTDSITSNLNENDDKTVVTKEEKIQAEEKVENVVDSATSESNKNVPKTEEATDTPPKHSFKMPMIGPLRKSSSAKDKTPTPAQDVPAEEPAAPKEPSKDAPEEKKVTVPYKEPSWSGPPDMTYKFEVLKSGVILETIDLSKKNFHVVGRSPNCDISMAHPSISRNHAIIQFRAVGDEKNGKGLYVYDLDSTHGTYWNGSRIRSKTYVRIQGGHLIKFGGSQRKFILLAPSDDQEEESEYSITELKEMRRLEIQERKRQEEEELNRLKELKEKEESEGIDWGMGEDADEETDLTENPYAQTGNEELFLDDPKKTLRGWFEREGQELTYQTEEKGVGKFLCWVDLPLDDSLGRKMRAETVVTGKKKEAVVQCALEACRILDRHGLLRQANHEAKKRKVRNWEEEDFYDSDEDNFLDRTGTVEKKREKRMQAAGKLVAETETYDTLLAKHAKLIESIKSTERIIELHKLKQLEMENADEDALDAFMSSLETSALDKTEIRKKKIDLLNMKKEETRLLKLINIAKPANLPPLKPYTEKLPKEELKESLVSEKKSSIQKPKSKLITMKIGKPKSESDTADLEKKPVEEDSEKDLEIVENIPSKKAKESTEASSMVVEESEDSKPEEIEEPQKKVPKKKNRPSKLNPQRLPQATDEPLKSYDEEKFGEDYDMWVPPDNQSGDGKTNLNEKFGY